MQKRRGEPGQVQKWVSHNKVLVGSGDGGGSKKPHARNPNFDSEETKLLIQLWGDPQVQRTLITVHKKHPVISKIADKMRAYGYNRSTEEINTRIKNLKCLYNRIKKDLDSGLLNESSWKHYNAMHEILSRPVFGNAATNKPLPTMTKIIISPSTAAATAASVNGGSSNGDNVSEQTLFKVKEEEISEDEEANDSSMEFDGSELRPEDLLSVIETEHENDVEIKEEPMDVATITEIKTTENEKLDAESSLKQADEDATTPSTVNANIVNYANDSLSITSVQGNANSSVSSSGSVGGVGEPMIISPKQLSSQPNKISLVPTKLLLKPQAVNGFKQTSHAIVTSQAVTAANATITSNAQNSSSSIPMKVVFVNALNSNAQQAAKQQLALNKTLTQQLHTQSVTGTQTATFITNKILGTGAGQKVQLVNQLPSPTVTPKISASTISIQQNSPNSSSSNIKSSHHHHHHQSSAKSKTLLGSKLPVIRSLLTNIVEIENQRLEIERQRFEYEKRVGSELLSLLKTFMHNKSTPPQAADPPNQLNDANE